MTPLSVENVVKTFKLLALYPSPTSARILRGGAAANAAIVSSWSQRNLERSKSVKFQRTQIINMSTQKVTDMLPVDISTEQMSSFSASEEFRCVIREVSQDNSTSPRKQYLEVWKDCQLYRNFDLVALEVHGDVYTDEEFACLDWSPCESKVVYVAEQKVPKSEPFYKPKAQECKENDVGSHKIPQKGEEYTYREDWGELLVGRHKPVVVVCDIKTELLTVLEAVPAEYSPGQVVWTPDGRGVVGVAWKNEPRRLGLVYCTSRPSVIFHLTLDGSFSIISSEDQAVRSPRFSPDGKYLVWLERPFGGPHHSGHRLMCCKWQSKKVDILVDLVHEQTSTSNGTPFYGLYGQRLPRRCWASDSRRLLLSSPQCCRTASFVIDAESGHIQELEWPAPDGRPQGSLIIADVCDDLVVMVRSSLREPASLVLGALNPIGQKHSTQWPLQVTACSPPPELAACEVHCMALQADEESDSVRNFNAIYIGPQHGENGSVPLIVYPHGGPHAVFTDEFSLTVSLMVLQGFGVLLVNYRGSTGNGIDSVNFLLGRVGDTDVKDVHQAALAALEKYPCLNPKKLALFGGSHGGFLVLHLSGQYPDSYCAVVARNPVTDVACMSGISDIPDWCYAEAGQSYNPAGIISKDTLEAMRQCSPIQHAAKVKAPTLLMLGKKDLRVPYSQGLLFHHTLHANGVKTKVHVYEDTHGLSQVPVEMDNVINSILWINQHLA